MAYAAYQPYMPPAPAVPFDPRMRTWQDWSYEDVKQVPDLAQEADEAAMLARPVADLFPDPDGGVPSYAPPPKAITAGPATADPLAAHSTPGKAQYKMGHDYLHWDTPKAQQQQQHGMDPVLYNFAVDWPADVQEQFAEIALNPTTHTLVPHQAPLAYTPAHKMPMAPSIAYASGNAVYDAPPAILPSGPAFAGGALPPLEPAGIAPEMALALIPAPEPAAQPYQYVNNINKPSIVRPPSAPPAVPATPLPPLQGAATTVAAIAAASGKSQPASLPGRSPFPMTTAPLFPHATPMPPVQTPIAIVPPTPGKDSNKAKTPAKPLKSALARTQYVDPADQLAWHDSGPYPAQIAPGSGGRRRGASVSSVPAQTGTLPMSALQTPYISSVNGRAHMTPTAQLDHVTSQLAEQRHPGAIDFAQGAQFGHHFHPSPTGAPQPEPPSAGSKVKNFFGLGSGGGGKDKRKPAPPVEMGDPLFGGMPGSMPGGMPLGQDSWYQRSMPTPSLAEQARLAHGQRAQDEAHRKALAQAAKVHGSGMGTKTSKIGTTPLPSVPTHFAAYPGMSLGTAELTDAYGYQTKSASKKKR